MDTLNTCMIKCVFCCTIFIVFISCFVIVNLYQVPVFQWINWRVPLMLVNKAAQCAQFYPAVVCVKESIYTYQLTCEKVSLQRYLLDFVLYYVYAHMYVCMYVQMSLFLM